jgi:hydrogenase/urease accessory protein HupE
MKRFATALSAFSMLLMFLVSSTALAHQTGKSLYIAHVQPEAATVDTVTTFPAIDLLDHLGADDGDEKVSRDEWLNHQDEMRTYLESAIGVTAGGVPCTTTESSAKLTGAAQLVYLHSFQCSTWQPPLILRNQAMTEMAMGYSHIGRVQVGQGGEAVTAFNQAFPTYEVAIESQPGEKSPSLLDLFLRFVWQGIIHIVLGLDHVLFVVALVLISRDLKRLLGVVTAFTVSHSVTLALATLDVVTIPASIAEPIIAASILYVAAEAWFREDEPRYIYATTFVLGLVHGFGFSYVLADVGLPANSVVPALFAFNVGVELGQLGFILLLWPLRRLVMEKPWERRAVRGCAAVLAVVAAFWLVERVLAWF